MNLVATTCGDGAMASGKAECWTVVLTVVRVIWRNLRKVMVEVEMAYGSGIPLVMVGKCL